MNIFCPLWPQVFGLERCLVDDNIVKLAGHGDGFGASQGLNSGGLVDAIAHGVLAVENDIAEVQAQTVLQHAVSGLIKRLAIQFTLDRDGALDALDGAHENDHHAVAHGIQDLAVMLGDSFVDEVEVAVESSVGSFLVDRAVFAKGNDVGEHD